MTVIQIDGQLPSCEHDHFRWISNAPTLVTKPRPPCNTDILSHDRERWADRLTYHFNSPSNTTLCFNDSAPQCWSPERLALPLVWHCPLALAILNLMELPVLLKSAPTLLRHLPESAFFHTSDLLKCSPSTAPTCLCPNITYIVSSIVSVR